MADFMTLNNDTLRHIQKQLTLKYEEFKRKNLKLNMSRGKPCPEQLDLSAGLLEGLNGNYWAEDGTDCRNYGGLEGLPEARRLFAELLEVQPEEIIVHGNSSLALMHDLVARALFFGVDGQHAPWGQQPVKFLCPSPGYDRHFAICQFFNIEMITVPLREDGPDMDLVEELVATDETIKGIWCVPKHSNPTGITYSDQVVTRLARMKTKAPDFRIFWDNAYAWHDFTADPVPLKNILTACKEANHPDRVYIFSSTSKITYAGAGLAMVASSVQNINRLKKQMAIQTIGPNKLNQLAHVRFFKNAQNVRLHMQKHAAIIRPKFDLVLNLLQTELGDKKIATWSRPQGGYFISFDTMPGCAKKVVQMAADAGVELTKAGATFPYGIDPTDQNIRIAPTYPPLAELKTAMELFIVCVQLVSIEKILRSREVTTEEYAFLPGDEAQIV
ncbi:aminotransferase class I/II-fold pyridoxal phosphate-dependent enzyme [Capillibacterium thermochitinicola]|uniref:Aminotransferase class I/II-fold pyridoxal phosphate-dependent enzyme n=1 Tax=Capillibacterium thermochitinicola TaxID=2699427 RepID=A0A8J6LLV3_9FIRM|nr:aminotransferase class I/II-fold pyridoxal phosphate-dependent enzyme [Capillibacterium thermochitinicola]MBA2132814.1 aminotransferase class I/II-fold pyridoxal phosphate-dependent enzyme [Capillibacterium thermochitinicola]